LATCPASGVDDAAAVAVDQRQHRRLVLLEVAERRGLVLAHEAAVSGDVRRQDGGELHRGHAVVVPALFSMRRQAALGQHEECCDCWRSWAATASTLRGSLASTAYKKAPSSRTARSTSDRGSALTE
jgi:hypothetical protein